MFELRERHEHLEIDGHTIKIEIYLEYKEKGAFHWTRVKQVHTVTDLTQSEPTY